MKTGRYLPPLFGGFPPGGIERRLEEELSLFWEKKRKEKRFHNGSK